MKKLLFALALTCSVLVSCKEVDPDYASGIDGKYIIKSTNRNGTIVTLTDDQSYIKLTRTSDNTVKYEQHLAAGDTTYTGVKIDSYGNAFHLNFTDVRDTLTGEESYKNLTIRVKSEPSATPNEFTLSATRQ